MPASRFPAHGPDLRALLAACHAEPTDDTPRLVLADWLEEHDDPRGEFVRLQCRIAALAAGDPEYDDLYSRHQKWWKRYGNRVENEFGNLLWDTGPHDRGLPTVGHYDEEYCWLNSDDLQDPAKNPKDRLSASIRDGWASMTWVFASDPFGLDSDDYESAGVAQEEVYEDLAFDPFDLPPWTGSPTPLGVCFPDGQTVTPEIIARVAKVPNLRGLSLYECDAAPALLPRIGKLKALTHLDLGFVRLNDDGVKALAPLKSLRTLIAPNATVTNAGAARLAQFTELRELRLGTRSLRGTGYQSLAKLTNLEVLELEKCDDAAVRHLAPLSRLRRLNLSCTRVTGRGLDAFPLLTRLSLEDTPTDDGGLARVASLPRLQALDIAQTKVTGAALAHLSGLRWLEDLYASQTNVRDKHLVHLEGLTNLDFVSLWGTKVTKAAKKKFETKHKGVAIA